jgi:hypothetical protein
MTDDSSQKSKNEIVGRRDGGDLLDSAFSSLPEPQRQKLMEKAIEKKLELEVEAVKAEGRRVHSEIDMHNTVRHVRDLESSTKSDYSVKANFETASGNTSVEIKKSNNTTIIVVAVVVAIIFLAFFSG